MKREDMRLPSESYEAYRRKMITEPSFLEREGRGAEWKQNWLLKRRKDDRQVLQGTSQESLVPS